MKGPYERLKYDLRRLWECALCHRRERTDGNVTYCFCACQVKSGGQPVAMKLLEEAGHRTVPPIVPKFSAESAPLPNAAAESADAAVRLDTPESSIESVADPAGPLSPE